MSLLSNPEFLSDRIFVGIWERYHGSGYASKVLTLLTFKAIVLLGALVLVVDYTGLRFWVIVRFLIYYVIRKRGALPVELPL
jgi:hypothetical protein